MKTLTSLVLAISMTSAFAATDFTKRLECNVDTFGIKTITISEDNSDLIGWLKLDVEYKNGNLESRGISSEDFASIYRSDLYISRDGELNILLSKKASEYIISVRGDGINQSQVISCK
jgi:hypothetical protein